MALLMTGMCTGNPFALKCSRAFPRVTHRRGNQTSQICEFLQVHRLALAFIARSPAIGQAGAPRKTKEVTHTIDARNTLATRVIRGRTGRYLLAEPDACRHQRGGYRTYGVIRDPLKSLSERAENSCGEKSCSHVARRRVFARADVCGR